MIIVFDSRTNNVKRFVGKVQNQMEGIETIKLEKDLIISEPFHLVTFTTRIGEIPDSTLNFLSMNHQFVKSVSVSGNRNWGQNFGLALEKILEIYPNFNKGLKFEMSGISEDVESFIEILKKYNGD